MKSKSFSRSELSLSLALVIPLQIEENKEKFKIGTIDWKPGKYGQLSDQEKGEVAASQKSEDFEKKRSPVRIDWDQLSVRLPGKSEEKSCWYWAQAVVSHSGFHKGRNIWVI